MLNSYHSKALWNAVCNSIRNLTMCCLEWTLSLIPLKHECSMCFLLLLPSSRVSLLSSLASLLSSRVSLPSSYFSLLTSLFSMLRVLLVDRAGLLRPGLFSSNRYSEEGWRSDWSHQAEARARQCHDAVPQCGCEGTYTDFNIFTSTLSLQPSHFNTLTSIHTFQLSDFNSLSLQL